MIRPRALVLCSAGTNRDQETGRALEMAGADARVVQARELQTGAVSMADFQALVLPGGFSYGDALGAGVLQALDLTTWLHEALASFVSQGGQVLGICNGFQTLVKAGLLECSGRKATPMPRRLTLTHNARGRFECRWVYLAVNVRCAAGWLQSVPGPIFCPVAHGEGRFQVCAAEVLHQLQENRQIAFWYTDAQGKAIHGAYPHNPNGSLGDIAGLSNPDGSIVGLMPHPEDHVRARHAPVPVPPGMMGLRLFEAFVGAL